MLETAFVRVPAGVELMPMWREIDEQNLPADVRRDLAANGMRSGIVGLQLPSQIRELLDAAKEETTNTEAIASGSVTAIQQQLQSRAGERSVLVVVPELPNENVVLFNDAGRVSAKTFDSGQALFAIKTHPFGDGTVELELTPEIKHGDVQHQWVPGNGSFKHDFSRAALVFEQLRLATVVSPGQTLLVTCTAEAKGLGGLFFTKGSQPDAERLVLLIRLAQTQYDDLFDSEETPEPLATPFE
ncbi:MAG: hypothetical protein CMJ64_04985 [Planctomycetaceae bacterium]|nr:hypothetical protein [Planctomycetaceae bacterium]